MGWFIQTIFLLHLIKEFAAQTSSLCDLETLMRSRFRKTLTPDNVICIISNSLMETDYKATRESIPINLTSTWNDISPQESCKDYAKIYRNQEASCRNALYVVVKASRVENRANVSFYDHGKCESTCYLEGGTVSSENLGAAILDHTDEHFLKILTWTFTIIGAFGNVAVMLHCGPQLVTRFRNLTQTEKVHHWLVLNLAVSDFLMSVYLFLHSVKHIHSDSEDSETFDEEHHAWLQDPTCRILGFISFLSCQVSLTMLVVITTFRLYCVVRPYQARTGQFKPAVIAALVTWITWSFVAILPLLPFEPFHSVYQSFVHVSKPNWLNQTDLHFDDLLAVVQNVENLVLTACEDEDTLLALTNPTWKELLNASSSVGIVRDLEWANYYGFYNEHVMCMAPFFTVYTSRSVYFTMCTVTFNLVSFAWIAFAYIYIDYNTSRQTCFQFALFRCQFVYGGATNRGVITSREEEDRSIHRKIVFVILANFVCWVPVCILSVFHTIYSSTLGGHVCCRFHEYVNKYQPQYSVLEVVVVPINSILNPYIYSLSYWSDIKQNIRGRFQRRP